MSSKKLNLLYAIKQGDLVYIDDVDNGINCNCICPGCGGNLIARQGKVMMHHFAHQNAECKYGYQTSLHLLAKEILSETKEIWLPPSYSILGMMHDWTKFTIDNVYLEQSEENYIPDVTLEIGGKKIFIEIYVTHKVDNKKLFKLMKSGISTIEIDLSDIDRNIDKEYLKDILIGKYNNKQWIYNSAEYKCNKELIEIIEFKTPFSYDAVECPINKRMSKRGNIFADVYKDCQSCMFNIKHNKFFGNLADKEINMECDLEDYTNNSELSQYLLTINLPNYSCGCTGKHLLNSYADVGIPYKDLYQKYYHIIDSYKHNLINKKCPQCSAKLKERVNHNTGEIYIACENYKSEWGNTCSFTYDIIEYENLVKKLQTEDVNIL